MKYIIFLTLFYGAFGIPVDDQAFQEFVNGNHQFTASVYKQLLKSESGNFLVSPVSAEIILALLNEGAKGETSSELIRGLSLPDTKAKIQKVLKSYLPNLKQNDNNTKLLSANKIYIKNGLKLKENFQSLSTSIYNAGVENIDFQNKGAAVATINKWVEDNTNQKIKDLMNQGDIDKYTRLVLVNTLYFSGKWSSTFDDYSTSKKKFYKTKDDATEIDTMQQLDTFNYYENPTLKAKFLELRYIGNEISMVIVLPNEIEGLASLEQNIEPIFAPQPFEPKRVHVALPKFTTETEIDFTTILKALGINKIFSDDEADLSGISSTDEALVVSQVKQKAFINVTEEGTEAAAATKVVVAVPTSAIIDPRPIFNFQADHPFLFFIKLKETVLFAGRFVKPKA